MLAADTERIGNSIINDLQNQQEKLLGTRNIIQDTKVVTNTARKLLNAIGNRALLLKFMLVFLNLIFLVLICMLIYFIIKK